MSSMCPMVLAAARTSSVFNAGSKRCRCVSSSSSPEEDFDDAFVFSARADERRLRRRSNNTVDTAPSDRRRRRRRPTTPLRRRILLVLWVQASQFFEAPRGREANFVSFFLCVFFCLGFRCLFFFFLVVGGEKFISKRVCVFLFQCGFPSGGARGF